MPQASLGAFSFSLENAEFSTMTRRIGMRWASRQRRGNKPMREFLGAENEKTQLRGFIIIQKARDKDRLKLLEAESKRGEPLDLFISSLTHYDFFREADGFINRHSSDYRGRWVVDSVLQEHRELDRNGSPIRINFTIEISEANDLV